MLALTYLLWDSNLKRDNLALTGGQRQLQLAKRDPGTDVVKRLVMRTIDNSALLAGCGVAGKSLTVPVAVPTLVTHISSCISAPFCVSMINKILMQGWRHQNEPGCSLKLRPPAVPGSLL